MNPKCIAMVCVGSLRYKESGNASYRGVKVWSSRSIGLIGPVFLFVQTVMTGPMCFAELKATVWVCGIIWGLLRPLQGSFLHVGVGYEWVGSYCCNNLSRILPFPWGYKDSAHTGSCVGSVSGVGSVWAQ